MNEWNECIDIVHVMIIHNIHESIDNIDDEPQKKNHIDPNVVRKGKLDHGFFFIFSRLFTQVCSFSFFSFFIFIYSFTSVYIQSLLDVTSD